MSKWHRTDNGMPEVAVGDRVIGLGRWREHPCGPFATHIAVLTAIEGGWHNEDGWDIHDMQWLCRESDLVDDLMATLTEDQP